MQIQLNQPIYLPTATSINKVFKNADLTQLNQPT